MVFRIGTRNDGSYRIAISFSPIKPIENYVCDIDIFVPVNHSLSVITKHFHFLDPVSLVNGCTNATQTREADIWPSLVGIHRE